VAEALIIRPIALREAQRFVAIHHRHNAPPRGHLFSAGLYLGDELVAVGIAGRPLARALQDGVTLEILRTCVADLPTVENGHAHCANSRLMGALWRAGRALGYCRGVTYTRADEPGTSLRAANWTPVADLAPRTLWHPDAAPTLPGLESKPSDGVARIRWEIMARP